jgi:hypothetical protein
MPTTAMLPRRVPQQRHPSIYRKIVIKNNVSQN